jgi:precorrin-2 dehydrogenase / sirohydrochlorin ferrochelatase
MTGNERPMHYPVALDLAGRLAVVVGGSATAVRAATSLAEHGADVVVISRSVPPELLSLEVDGRATIEQRGYVRGDLEGAAVAFARSGSAETDAAVAAEARERNVLVNVESDPSASSFVVPSVVERGQLQIAVSTGGSAPAVTREVRHGIADAHGWEWGRYVDLMGELRSYAMQRTGLTDADLKPMFDAVGGAPLRYRIRAGEEMTAEQLYERYAETLAEAEKGGTGA